MIVLIRENKKINFEQFKTLILSQNFKEERIKNLVLNKLIMKEMIILFSISNLINVIYIYSIFLLFLLEKIEIILYISVGSVVIF